MRILRDQYASGLKKTEQSQNPGDTQAIWRRQKQGSFLCRIYVESGALLASYDTRIIDPDIESNMEQDSIDNLGEVACITNPHIAYHRMKPASERKENEEGAAH